MADPFLPELPQRLGSWQNNWSRRMSGLSQAGVQFDQVRPLVAWDMQRTQEGGTPISDREAALAVRAIIRGEPFIEPPERQGIGDRLIDAPIDDIRRIVTSLPKLPQAIAGEVARLPQLPQLFEQALNTPGDAGDKITAVTELPGVNFLPGAYVAGRLAQGREGLAEIADNPVSSLLDVAPYLSRVGAGAALGRAPGVVHAREALTRWMDRQGIGGPDSRSTISQFNQVRRSMQHEMIPEIKGIDEVLAPFDEATQAQIIEWAQRRKKGEEPPPEWKPAVDLLQRQNERWMNHAIESGTGFVGPNGEFYSTLSRTGKALRDTARFRERTAEQLLKQRKRVDHHAERLELDQARIAEMEQMPSGVGDWASTLDDISARVRDELDKSISLIESEVPKAVDPVAVNPAAPAFDLGTIEWPDGVPRLRPGEQSYLAGRRTPDRKPITTREVQTRLSSRGRPPTNPITRKASGEITSELRESTIAELTNHMRTHGRIGEPASIAKMRQDIQRLENLLERSRAGAAIPTEAAVGLADTMVEVAKRFRIAGDTSGWLMSKARDLRAAVEAGDEAAIAAIRAEVDNLISTEGMSAIRRSEGAPAAKVIRDAGFRFRESIAKFDEGERVGSGARVDPAAVEARLTSTRELLDAAEVQKRLRDTLRFENQRLARVRPGSFDESGAALRPHVIEEMVERVGKLDPREIELQNIYRLLDDVESGKISLDEGSVARAQEAAARIESQGVTVSPESRKAQVISRARERHKAATEAPRTRTRRKTRAIPKEARAAIRARAKVRTRLFGDQTQPGLFNEATAAMRGGDFDTAKVKLDQIARIAGSDATKALAGDMARLADEARAARKDLAKLPARNRRLEHHRQRSVETQVRLERERTKYDELVNRLDKAYQREASAMERAVPARFQPMAQERFREMMEQQVRESNPELASVEAWAEGGIADRLVMRDYDGLLTRKEVRSIEKAAAKTWWDARQAGYDPIFVHQVPPLKTRSVSRMGLFPDRVATPGQLRDRALDAAPYEKNLNVALTHQSLEWHQKHYSEIFLFGDEAAGIPGIMSRGKSYSELIEKHMTEIQARASKQGIPMDVAAEQTLRKYYALLKPFEFVNWHTGGIRPGSTMASTRKITRMNGQQIDVPTEVYVPHGVYKVMSEMMPKESGPMAVKGLYDKAMDVFRISVLGYSPRFYLYNVVGGGLMTAARTSPMAIIKYWDEAYQMVGKPRNPINDMPIELSRGAAYVPEFVTQLSEPANIISLERGKVLGRMWNNVKRGAEWSFDMNEWIDNMYRSISYLYGRDKGLARGLSDDAAKAEGIRLSNKVLQDWDSMLPWERTVLRSVVPFYGWFRHIMTYTFTYPIDHPVRASVIAAAGRAAWEDYNDALPERFMETFWIGDPDEEGNQWSINAAGGNPWGDIADAFSMAGFLSQLSPIFQAGAEIAGLDPMSGRGRLFPDLTYDPVSGRLVAQGDVQPIEAVVGSFVPQVTALTGALGFNQNMQELAQTNPEAWRARIFNSVGIPFAPRRRSQSEEITRAEFARDQAATQAVRQAMRTGSWDDALRYPVAFVNGVAVNPAELKRRIEEMQAASGGTAGPLSGP